MLRRNQKKSEALQSGEIKRRPGITAPEVVEVTRAAMQKSPQAAGVAMRMVASFREDAQDSG